MEETEGNEVNFQISDNNVQQSDARKVIISITSTEEDKEQSRISMSVDDIINSLKRSEPIDNCLDGDDGKKQVSENNQITESIMRRMDQFSESNVVDSMELYRLRQSNIDLPVSVSATTETDSDEQQILIMRKNKTGKKGKEQRKCELMSDSQ